MIIKFTYAKRFYIKYYTPESFKIKHSVHSHGAVFFIVTCMALIIFPIFFNNDQSLIKFAGVAPLHYESSQFAAQHTAITKKGSKYLRETLYQIILPVININPVFKQYYQLKISQGKGHRCAQGHCVRKLLRVIYHLLSTGQQFDSEILR